MDSSIVVLQLNVRGLNPKPQSPNPFTPSESTKLPRTPRPDGSKGLGSGPPIDIFEVPLQSSQAWPLWIAFVF